MAATELHLPIVFSPDYRVHAAGGVTVGINPHGDIELHFWKDHPRPESVQVNFDDAQQRANHTVTMPIARYFECAVSLPAEQVEQTIQILQEVLKVRNGKNVPGV